MILKWKRPLLIIGGVVCFLMFASCGVYKKNNQDLKNLFSDLEKDKEELVVNQEALRLKLDSFWFESGDKSELSNAQSNMQLMTRNYLQKYIDDIEKTIESVQKEYSDSVFIKPVLIWQMNTEAAATKAVLHTVSEYALVDYWLLSLQQQAFLKSAATKKVFGIYSDALNTTGNTIVSDIEAIAKKVWDNETYLYYDDFVHYQAKKHPITNLDFFRPSTYTEWLAYIGENEIDVFNGINEVMDDLNSRMNILFTQIPRQLYLRSQSYLIDQDLDMSGLQLLFDDLAKLTKELNTFFGSDGKDVRIAKAFGAEMQPIMDRFMQDFREERIMISTSLENGSYVVADLIKSEREGLTKDLNEIVQSTIKTSFEHLKDMIWPVIMAIILLFFFFTLLPMYIGYRLGKR